MRRARSSSLTARTESPPPTTEYASESATAIATAFVPSAKRGHSKTPIGPFQKIVFAVPRRLAKRSRRLRADVETEPAVGNGVVGNHLRLGLGVEVGGGDDVVRKLDVEIEGILVPELLRHLPADEHEVRPATPRCSRTPSLSFTLAPPATSANGRSTSPSSRPRCVQLLLEQQACIRRQDVGHTFGRRRARGARSRKRR